MVPTDTPFSLALTAPSKLIDRLANGLSTQPSSSTSATTSLSGQVSKAFREAFPDRESRVKIPYLTATNAPSLLGKTVRMRAMVQDNSLGNEIVLSTLPGGSSALYGGDSAASSSANGTSEQHEGLPMNPSAAELAERAVLFGVTLPGRSRWAASCDAQSIALDARADHLGDSADQTPPSSSSQASMSVLKNKLPLPDEDNALGVMLKMYDVSEAESLQVNDIIDVVGILDLSALPSSEWASSGAADMSGAEEEAQVLYPTIHVAFFDKLADVYSPPKTPSSTAASPALNSSPSSRSNLKEEFTRVLDGDENAAEWTLLAAIANVHTRRAPLVLGHLSVRLLLTKQAGSSSTATRLQALLADLMPSVAPLQLTLPSLNAQHVHLSPKSEGDSLGLRSGRLQLPRGTMLAVDESIAEGTLNEHGLVNLRSLQNLLQNSTLSYLFPFAPAPYSLPADVGCIVVSAADEEAAEGRVAGGGLVQCDVEVVVRPSETKVEDSPSSSSTLRDMRTHILRARKAARELRVGQDVAEAIQKDFVERRRSSASSSSSSTGLPTTKAEAAASAAAAASASQEDLLRRIDVARLIAASHLRTDLSFEDYKRAVEMDEARVGDVVAARTFRTAASA